MKSKILLLLILVTLGFSCNQTLQDNATISLKLTDDPAVYDEVWIDIISVYIKYDNADEDIGWVQLTDFVPGNYNILDYCNGKDALLVSSEIAAGTISQIRLILGSANYFVTGAKSYALETPSANTTGLKLNVHETFEQGVEKEIWLDFDVSKSIVETGSDKYQLKPVIRTYTTASSGAIKGTINPKEALPKVFVVLGTETISTFADPTGYFLIGGVPGGNYTVIFQPIAPYVEKSIENVEVTNGETTNLGEVIMN
jgi:hypothetical protein